MGAGIGFVPIERLMAAINPVPDPPPFRRRPMRAPEPYYPNDDERPPPMPYYPREREPAPPPEPPRTAEQQLRETVSIIRTAAGMAREISALTGQQMGPSQQEVYEPPEDDSPISVIQAGPAKLVINKKDGSLRKFETGWANMPDLLKWMGEQHESIQRHAAARQQRQAALPEGFVELTPGYRPPAGYVAVPLNQPQPQEHLPPPPAFIPPPIQSAQSQQPRTWAAPTIDDRSPPDPYADPYAPQDE